MFGSEWERVVCMSQLKFGSVRTWNIGTVFNSYVICFMADHVIYMFGSEWERVVCMSQLKFGSVRTWNIGTVFNSYVICFMADHVISLTD